MQGATTTEGYSDDGEFGTGRVVKNDYMNFDSKMCVCVFVTRHYGGEHIGPKEIRYCERPCETNDGTV